MFTIFVNIINNLIINMYSKYLIDKIFNKYNV